MVFKFFEIPISVKLGPEQDFMSRSSAHLTLRYDPLCECWSSAHCSVFWCGCRSTVAHTGYEQEGAVRIGGGAGETVGVTGVGGTDWLISHSHLQGIKDREA